MADPEFGIQLIEALEKKIETRFHRQTRNEAQGFALTDPAQAATAQSSFDCWVEQLEEGWPVSHIKQCRAAFEAALDSWHAQQITVSAIVTSRTADVMNAGNAEAPGCDHTADEDDGICENES